MPSDQLKATVAALDEAGNDPATRSILLRSGGSRTFCAGANLDELLAIDDFPSGRAFFMGFAELILAMRRCPKPIVVAVQGKAIGGGVGIASAADYCMATEAASIKLSELAIAIGPFVILPALVRKMGVAAATELSLDTEWHSAEWAHAKGLYQRVFSDQESLMEAAGALAKKLANYSLEAASELKHTLWTGTDHWPDLLEERAGVSGRLVLRDSAKAALSKFKKK
jgi:methylglutaconyl-CoA hydratase